MRLRNIASLKDDQLRDLLAKASLEWEKKFSVAPKVTGDLAEYDAAKLKGASLSIGKGRYASDTADRYDYLTLTRYAFLGSPSNIRSRARA